jgi:hypothetical protein
VRGAEFRETTSTVAVNAHGGLVILKATVARGDLIWLTNPTTTEEVAARVVFLDEPEDDGITVGIEFSEPSPFFWQIHFPPDDWQNSEERKRPGSNPPPK